MVNFGVFFSQLFEKIVGKAKEATNLLEEKVANIQEAIDSAHSGDMDDLFEHEDTFLRYSIETDKGHLSGRLEQEVKIDVEGKIYFKERNKWEHKPEIKAISFARE
jgi:hypothetical protein